MNERKQMKYMKPKCEMCGERHGRDKDPYVCYSIYRSNNPRPEIEGSIEIWNGKEWVKR